MNSDTKIISNIERQVMAGVGTVYVGRQLTGTTALKVYALILSLWAVGRLVWVSKVFANFMEVERGGVSAISNYTLYALEHTHLGVQLALLVAAVAFISLVVDTVRSTTTPQTMFA